MLVDPRHGRLRSVQASKRWANDLTVILNARGGDDRFPVDVKQLAYDYTKQVFPGDPISLVQGASLPGFEGALFKAPEGELGWGIFYNSNITSPGRINFTLAHEFGHYLLHRQNHPDGKRRSGLCHQPTSVELSKRLC